MSLKMQPRVVVFFLWVTHTLQWVDPSQVNPSQDSLHASNENDLTESSKYLWAGTQYVSTGGDMKWKSPEDGLIILVDGGYKGL